MCVVSTHYISIDIDNTPFRYLAVGDMIHNSVSRSFHTGLSVRNSEHPVPVFAAATVLVLATSRHYCTVGRGDATTTPIKA